MHGGQYRQLWYDPMLAKLIVHAPTRAEAVKAAQAAVDQSRMDGIETNLRWLRDVVRSPAFVTGEVSTRCSTISLSIPTASV